MDLSFSYLPTGYTAATFQVPFQLSCRNIFLLSELFSVPLEHAVQLPIVQQRKNRILESLILLTYSIKDSLRAVTGPDQPICISVLCKCPSELQPSSARSFTAFFAACLALSSYLLARLCHSSCTDTEVADDGSDIARTWFDHSSHCGKGLTLEKYLQAKPYTQ